MERLSKIWADGKLIPWEEANVHILTHSLHYGLEAFFKGTTAELTPIREIDNRILGNGTSGPVTKELQAAFFDIVKGKNSEYREWLDYL